MIVVADNLNVINPVVAAALQTLEAAPLQELARRCEQAGAKIMDINPGYLSARHEDRMVFMVEAVQQVSHLRLMLDSPNPRVLAQGLAACNQTPVLNALTLEPEKLREILPLAAAHDSDLVLLLLDERSFPPPSLEGKVTVALPLRDAALNAGVKEERLIFDAVLPNLSWPDAWAQVGAIVKLVRLLTDGALFQIQRPHPGGPLQPQERPAPDLLRQNRRVLPLPAGRGRPHLRPGRRAAAGGHGDRATDQPGGLSFKFRVSRYTRSSYDNHIKILATA